MSKFSQEAKQFILAHRYGMLCTISSEGYPFGSVVAYAVSEDEQSLIIQVAQIAEHFQNLKHTPQSTLLVSDPFGAHDPTKYPRATIFVHWTELEAEERAAAKKEFERYAGNIVPSEIEPSFSYFHSEIEKIRWIGGFAKVGWVSKEEYTSAQADPLARESYGIVTHMNEDHAQAVQEMVSTLAGADKAMGAKMVQASSESIMFRLVNGEEIKWLLPIKCTSSEQIRKELIKFLKSIRCSASDGS